MSIELHYLFELHSLVSCEKQHRLAALVGDRRGRLADLPGRTTAPTG